MSHSLDARILMCEECRLYPQECRGDVAETWTLANGMEVVPCADHLNHLEQDEHDVA